jgi:hypothetical protein
MEESPIQFPDLNDLDPEQIVFSYDEEADSLLIHFFGRPMPAESVPIDQFVLLRVRPDTNELVGVEIEAFVHAALGNEPRYLAFAELAGVPERLMSKWRRSGSSRSAKRRVLAEFQEHWQGARI